METLACGCGRADGSVRGDKRAGIGIRMANDPGVRRIVVGIDGSAESVAALRWACREASLRRGEVHAVLALESGCHQVASYAVPAPRSSSGSGGAAREVLHRSVREAASLYPGIRLRTEITEGL